MFYQDEFHTPQIQMQGKGKKKKLISLAGPPFWFIRGFPLLSFRHCPRSGWEKHRCRAPGVTPGALQSHVHAPAELGLAIPSPVPPSRAGEGSSFLRFSGYGPALAICSHFPTTPGVRPSTFAGSQGPGQKPPAPPHMVWGRRGGLVMQTGPQAAPPGVLVPHQGWSFSLELPASPASQGAGHLPPVLGYPSNSRHGGMERAAGPSQRPS